MPEPYHQLDLNDFIEVLQQFPLTRHINAVHLHHTVRPDHTEYSTKQQDAILALARYHTQTRKWRDVAYHIAVAPDGTIWTGRNWNLPPCSAAGHNGNNFAGPFMVALIGDFNGGHDFFEGRQREVAVQVIARIQKHCRLAPRTLNFASQLSATTSPGAGIKYEDVLQQVEHAHSEIGATTGTGAAAADSGSDSGPFGHEVRATRQVIDDLSRDSGGTEPADAEPNVDVMTEEELRGLFEAQRPVDGRRADGRRGTRGLFDANLPPGEIARMRRHLINLSGGRFASSGDFETVQGHVDEMFSIHLEGALRAAQEKNPAEKLRLVFYAHGGLVGEAAGLQLAHRHIDWWNANNVYPIYFLWETGPIETFLQVMFRGRADTRALAPRGFVDRWLDPAVERAVRRAGAPALWERMKRNAEAASARNGGALCVAQKLGAFCKAHPDQVELHAVGHSAGSIFHAHFIPRALEAGAPSFTTTHFLAPAIRLDTFHTLLDGKIGKGKGIDHLTIFTMFDELEQDDFVGPGNVEIYHKSLLYLIYHALEPRPQTPLLGMEICLRADSALKTLLGWNSAVTPANPPAARVVWSTTLSDKGRSASTAKHHGDFDDDPPTMNSVACRILGPAVTAPLKEFPKPLTRDVARLEEVPEELAFLFEEQTPTGIMPGALSQVPVQPGVTSASTSFTLPAGVGVAQSSVAQSNVAQPSAAATQSQPTTMNGSVRRRALCVGINRYATAPLSGCVADARAWSKTFEVLGFETPVLLLDEQATRSAILDALNTLVASSSPGDVLAFQFAGHGTTLPDPSGDETGGDTPNHDEAICPFDFGRGAFVVDDDIAEVFERLPADVNLTCFIDCCHSGTITRFAIGLTPQGANRNDERVRFLVADEAMKAAHLKFREGLGGRRSVNSGGLNLMKEVVFSACLSNEVAYESSGHGDFTLRATRLLGAGLPALSNEAFQQQVSAEFGSVPRQHPGLYCHPQARGRGLLQPLISRSGGQTADASRGSASQNSMPGTAGSMPELLRVLAATIERGC